MTIKRYYVCKKTDSGFIKNHKYQFVKKTGKIISLKKNDETIVLTEDYFKEHFKRTAIY